MNDEPPTTADNRLHHALVVLDQLSRIPSPVVAALIALLGAVAGALWHVATGATEQAVLSALLYVGALAVDWLWLGALPKRGISYGPAKPPLFGLVGLRFIVCLMPVLGCTVGMPLLACTVAGIVLQLGATGAVIYATGVEPFRLGVTRIELETPKLPPGQQLRLVQVSDLHVERITERERDLVDTVNGLEPDYILLTGDYLNFSFIGEARAVADARQVLGALQARRGLYAVRGTHQVDPNTLLPTLLDGLPIRWLRNEHVTVSHNGYRLTFAGTSCTRDRAIDVPALHRALDGVPGDAFTVLLYHTPDLVPEAAAGGVDLYLAGHTHGGQIRLPVYGALLTATEVGKRHEMGRYDVDGLTLYVSRGIGMEGRGAPRARFLCPPEVVCVDVVGAAPP